MAPHDPPHMSPPGARPRACPRTRGLHALPRQFRCRPGARAGGVAGTGRSRMSSRESSPPIPRDQIPLSCTGAAPYPPHTPSRAGRPASRSGCCPRPLPARLARVVPGVASRESPAGAAPPAPLRPRPPRPSRSSAAPPSVGRPATPRAPRTPAPSRPGSRGGRPTCPLNHVRLQETYINVETLEEREAEKQLSQAWKRKREELIGGHHTRLRRASSSLPHKPSRRLSSPASSACPSPRLAPGVAFAVVVKGLGRPVQRPPAAAAARRVHHEYLAPPRRTFSCKTYNHSRVSRCGGPPGSRPQFNLKTMFFWGPSKPRGSPPEVRQFPVAGRCRRRGPLWGVMSAD
ncbi:translation initiation factor IF-2-like [Penaeus monodon]|uniref:translation initiation factor IF-2-like n=1 Tax=Penaeus monodon TaxID=6687 RepID=UPI0018A6EBE4|nr:translation initiation factor IF-2-like [Penaeus monodon]